MLAAYIANLRQEQYLVEVPPPPNSAAYKAMTSTNAPGLGTNAPSGTNTASLAGTNTPAAATNAPAK
jgi:hypothetical protein